MTRALLPLALSLLACGCDITALDQREQAIAVNSCNSDADCKFLGQCQDHRCLSSSGSFSTLLFEVAPIANGVDFTPPQVFLVETDLPAGGGNYSLVLPDASSVDARVNLGKALPASCVPVFQTSNGTIKLPPASDGTIPVRMTFTPSEQRWGTIGDSTPASVKAPNATPQTPPASYELQTKLVAGNYDVYVEPFAQPPQTDSGDPCFIAPFLLRGQSVGAAHVTFATTLPEPSQLLVDVRWPAQQGSLQQWTIDMVDPLRGRAISTRQTVRLATDDPNPLYQHYRVTLDYYPVAGADAEAAGGEIVRLTPPDGVVAPTLLFERQGLELGTPGTAAITDFNVLPQAVRLRGQVFDAVTSNNMPASVTLLATSLLGLETLPVAFRRQIDTDASGAFSVDLLPGHYQVRTVPLEVLGPDGTAFVAATTELDVAPTPNPQAQVFPVPSAITLSGSVFVPGESAAARGAAISADPSAQVSVPNFYETARTISSSARSASSSVDDSGNFTVSVESGQFDLSVRPTDAAGFSWLVVPGLDVTGSRSLSRLSLQFPVRLNLQVSLPSGGDPNTLVGAQVQAFALLDEQGAQTLDPARAHSALLIGQTRLGVSGAAQLLLPKTINFNVQ